MVRKSKKERTPEQYAREVLDSYLPVSPSNHERILWAFHHEIRRRLYEDYLKEGKSEAHEPENIDIDPDTPP